MPVPGQIRNVDLTGLRFRLIDAKEQVVGRLAAHIAVILQGKDKPIYSPEKDLGDVVVVTNGGLVEFTGKKWRQHLYRWHTGHPGGLKEREARFQLQQDPTSVLWKAVNGMMPKNTLRQARMRKLRIFASEDHPFRDDPRLVEWEMPPRRLRVKEGIFELPDGFEPLNPAIYQRRFGHQLSQERKAQLFSQPTSDLVPQQEGLAK